LKLEQIPQPQRHRRQLSISPSSRVTSSSRPDLAQILVDNLDAREDKVLHASLSERELQTLQKIASGMQLSEIVDELMRRPKTVSVYRATC